MRQVVGRGILGLVLEVEEKGGLFLPAIHSILGRAIDRDPTTYEKTDPLHHPCIFTDDVRIHLFCGMEEGG